MAMIKGVDSDVWIAALPSITIGGSPETCTDSGDHIVYTTSVHTAWDKNHPIILEQSANGTTGWTTINANQYTFAYPIGRITFDPARTPGVNNYVRVKATTGGYYYNVSQLDECHTWSLDQKANFQETTPFQATGGFRRKTFTFKEADGKIDSYHSDNTMFLQLGMMTVIRLYIDKPNSTGYIFYAWITGVSPKNDASSINEQAFSFSCEGEVYYSTTI